MNGLYLVENIRRIGNITTLFIKIKKASPETVYLNKNNIQAYQKGCLWIKGKEKDYGNYTRKYCFLKVIGIYILPIRDRAAVMICRSFIIFDFS